MWYDSAGPGYAGLMKAYELFSNQKTSDAERRYKMALAAEAAERMKGNRNELAYKNEAIKSLSSGDIKRALSVLAGSGNTTALQALFGTGSSRGKGKGSGSGSGGGGKYDPVKQLADLNAMKGMIGKDARRWSLNPLTLFGRDATAPEINESYLNLMDQHGDTFPTPKGGEDFLATVQQAIMNKASKKKGWW
jgi:hypothetical protein